jgi:endonuclease-3
LAKTKAKKKSSRATTKSRAKKTLAKVAKKGARPAKTRTKFRGMSDKKRVGMMIDVLGAEYPDAHCMLDFSSPCELLIATILAAQCTDVMVNRVTETLFKNYPSPQAFLDAPAEDIERQIYKTGFFRNKTKSIKKCCQALVDQHNGEVPSTMEELVALGGVGRKTANCVLGNAFGVPGIVVDTHVRRLANRMGFTVESNPDKIEMDLTEIVPMKEWTHFSHLLADHGRGDCDARKPRCDECPVEHLCPKIL